MTYSERLALAIELSGYKPREVRSLLAAAIGATPQALYQVLSGSSKALTAENSARAARFLRVDPYWLATGEGDPLPALSDEAIEFARRFDALAPALRAKVVRAMEAADSK